MYNWLSLVLALTLSSLVSALVREACHGQVKVFTATSGYFNTPNYGFGNYVPNDRCFWQILVNPGQRIKLEFKAFGMPMTGNCLAGDRVAVYDSDQETPESLVGSFCGNTLPRPIFSRSNKLFVKFVSDEAGEGPGFYSLYSALNDRPHTIPPANAGFRAAVTPAGANDVAPPMERVGPKCNGKVTVLTAPSGIIQSPNYGIGSYFPDDTCYWQIIAIPGKIIRIQLITMSLEEGTGCHNDYVTVYDGATESAPLLQAYCGRKSVPSELLTTGSAMFVKFHSDLRNQRDGFRFLYSLVARPAPPTTPPKPPTTPMPKDKCNGRHQIFTTKSGFLISPNFGYGEYYANDMCFWQILAPDGNKVKLSFQTFEVEDGFACPKDELVVYDGPSEMSPLIGSFCGSNKPATIVSSNNGLYLKFSTDAHAQYVGFKIFYEFVEPPKKERCTGEMNTLTETSGFIFSPNYGKGDYPEDDICHWQIIGQENTRVRLKVESLVMEDSPDCTKDYLSVWDGPGENANKMKVFCGSVAQEVLLSTNSYMYLKFKANGDGNYPGFKLFYEVVEAPPKDKCNGKTEVLHNQQGYFQSPNLGNGLYYNNDLCFWDVRAPPGKHIRLIFEKFDLEESEDCPQHDHLAIYDGQSEDSAQVADLCGYDLPKTIESSDNSMFVKFQTDAARRAAGFRIFYEFFQPAKIEPILPPPPEPCNGKEFLLTGTFGSFNSPNFGSGEYFPDDNCYWLVSSDYFNRIKLTFDSFDIEADPQCLRDRVIVYDGPTEQAPVLGTFCGYSLPNPIESSTAQILIKFESDSSAQRTGFKASYDTEPATPMHGILQDPRFMLYRGTPWIQPPVQQPVVASMPGLKPVPVDTSVPLLPHDRISPSGHVSTKLSASSANRPAKCNGAVTLVKANAFPMFAQSPNFGTGNYYPQDTCYWLIQSDIGTVIRLNFLSFDLEHGGRNCPNDFVQLYDGEGDQSPSLGRFCGSNLPNTVQSHGRSMLVEFNSDQSNEKPGFKFAYEAVTVSPPTVPPMMQLPGQNQSNPGAFWGRPMMSFPGSEHLPMAGQENLAMLKPGQFPMGPPNRMHVVPPDTLTIPSVPPVPSVPKVPGMPQTPTNAGQAVQQQLQQQTPQQHFQQQMSHLPRPQMPQQPRPQMPQQAQNRLQLPMQPRPSLQPQKPMMLPQFNPAAAGANFGNQQADSLAINPTVQRFSQQQSFMQRQPPQQRFTGPTSMPVVAGRRLTGYLPQRPRSSRKDATFDLSEDEEPGYEIEADGELDDEIIPADEENTADYEVGTFEEAGGTFMSVPMTPQLEEANHRPRHQFRPTKACRGRVVSLVAPADGTSYRVGSAIAADGRYRANDKCRWFLSGAQGKALKLKFLSYEVSGSDSSSCENDFIGIYDGVNKKSPLIGRYCTRNAPPTEIITNGSYAFIEFNAASSSPKRGSGFVFDFQEINKVKPNTDRQNNGGNSGTVPPASVTSIRPRCLGRQVLLTGQQGVIEPPKSQTGTYYPLDTCIWRISAEAGKKIVFQFIKLAVENTPHCQYDAVRLFDGLSSKGRQAKPLGDYCGTILPVNPIATTSNQAEVVFSSDSTVEDKGFLLSYRIV